MRGDFQFVATSYREKGFTVHGPREVGIGLELVGEHEPADLRGRVWVVELLGSEKLIEVEYGERSASPCK